MQNHLLQKELIDRGVEGEGLRKVTVSGFPLRGSQIIPSPARSRTPPQWSPGCLSFWLSCQSHVAEFDPSAGVPSPLYWPASAHCFSEACKISRPWKCKAISSGLVGSAAGSLFTNDTVSALVLSSAVMLDGLNRWGGTMAGLRADSCFAIINLECDLRGLRYLVLDP